MGSTQSTWESSTEATAENMKLLVAFAIVLFGVVSAEPGYGYGHGYRGYGGYGGGYGGYGHYGKRDAEAEPEADAEATAAAEPGYGYYGHGYGHRAYGYGYASPYAYGHHGYYGKRSA